MVRYFTCGSHRSSGVTIAKCIKSGMDNPSQADGGKVGIIAGDEESYEVFKGL